MSLLKSAIDSTKLQKLLSLITRINSEMELNAILVSIMEAAKDIMETEASSLMLVDEATGELIFVAPTGPASVDLSGKRIPKGKGIAGWVAQNNEIIVVNDVHSDKRFLGDTDNFVTRDIACVPMHNSKGVVTGVLQVVNRISDEFNKEDLTLFTALADQAAIIIEKARFQEQALEKERMEKEIHLARTIQEGLFPKHIPKIAHIDVAGKSMPAREVGGDYYDVIEVSNGKVLLVLADISGKGVGASLVMVELRAIIRLLALSESTLVDLVTKANNMLVDDTPQSTFVTLFLAIYDPNNQTLTYCNAGHNAPWLVHDSSVTELIEGGPIIGFMKGLPFEIKTVPFVGNDKLLIYTDGFSEGERADGEQVGEEELLEWFKNTKGTAQIQLDEIFRKLEFYVDGAEPSDDRTAIVVQGI